jgi:N6-adenosine-specific RNA methylase IME4
MSAPSGGVERVFGTCSEHGAYELPLGSIDSGEIARGCPACNAPFSVMRSGDVPPQAGSGAQTVSGSDSPNRYRTIVADPPWDIGRASTNWGSSERIPIELDYPTLSVEEIASLPVRDLAASDAHLYLWTINAFVEDAYQVARDWGFKPIRLLTWAKQPIGYAPGGTFSSTSEFILFCRRGSLRASEKIDRSWFDWPRQTRHSAKPEAFMDMVERISPEPRLEMFSRRSRFQWDTWGDQALNHVEVAS